MRYLLVRLPLCLLCLAPFHPDALPSMPECRSADVADDKKPLPTNDEMKRLAKEDPIGFLENCLRRHQRDVAGYKLLMEKQERINGKLHPNEVIEVAFREQPHSVFLRWLEGARRAQQALFVEGENNGMIVLRPTGRILGRLIVQRDPEGEEARESGRYSLKDFGLRKALERVLRTWKAARDDGSLFVEFLGEQKVKAAGNRDCWVLKRSRYRKPESDGVLEVTVFIDKETWLQVGSIVKGKDGELIGAYYFRDIQLNPTFKDSQFKPAALQP